MQFSSSSKDAMSSSIRFSDGGWHGGAKRPLRGQSLKDTQSLRMVQNHPPQTDDDDVKSFFKRYFHIVQILQMILYDKMFNDVFNDVTKNNVWKN